MFSFLRRIILIFFLFFVYIYSEEIYDFPSLLEDKLLELSQNNLENNEKEINKNFYIYTNLDYSSLDQLSEESTYLRAIILNLYLKDYYKYGEDFFGDHLITYDKEAKWLLKKIQREREGKNETEKKGLNLGLSFEDIETSLRLFGNQDISFRYGFSQYINKLIPSERQKRNYAYQYIFQDFFTGLNPLIQEPFLDPTLIGNGLTADQNLILNLKGKIGRKIELEVNHNSRNRRNTYRIEYVGDNDELLKKIKFGQIDLNVRSKSEFITAGGLQKEGFGVLLQGKKGPFSFESSLSLSAGVSEVKEFTIESKEQKTIRDIDYIKNRYFQLPDRNINEAHYYEEITDSDNYSQAFLVISNINGDGIINGSRYFKKLSEASYEIENDMGVFEHKKSKPEGHTLLFYNFQQTNGAYRSTTGTNASYFFGPSYTIHHRQNLSDTLTNFVIIFVSDEQLGDRDITNYYELRNRYRIEKSIEIESLKILITDNNNIKIDPSEWRGTFNHTFDIYGDSKISLNKGYFYFEDQAVFTRQSAYYANMYSVKEPNAENNNRINLELNYKTQYKNYIDLERFNIIPESVIIYKDNQLLEKKKYTVTSFGRIFFNKGEELYRGNKLKVYYEYRPFGSSLQKAIAAARMDWKFRGEENYIGMTLAGSLGQASLNAPQIGFESTSQLVGDIDTSIDLISMFQRRRLNKSSLILDGEYAFSIYNPNNNGKAIINTVEGDDLTFSFPGNHHSYYLTANPQLETLANRSLGKSYYIDFSEYSFLNPDNKVPIEFTLNNEQAMRANNANGLIYRQDVNFRPFNVRPGPYQVVSEGHLSRTLYPYQSSLVFDYDFEASHATTSPSNGYVSFITRAQFVGRSSDFKRYNTIEIIYKLLPTTDNSGNLEDNPKVLGFSIDIGNLNEDFDLDGQLDEENFISDADGFTFNYNKSPIFNTIETKLGAGDKGWNSPNDIAEGNGRKDTEDLNQNGQLDTLTSSQEQIINYPSSELGQNPTNYFLLFNSEYISDQGLNLNTFNTNRAFYEILDNNSSSTDVFQKERYIKITVPLRNLVTNNSLTKVTHLRLNFLEITNSAFNKGRVVIDSIRFKGTTWQQAKVDNNEVITPRQFLFSTINTKQDDFYNKNHLSKAYRRAYERLHGNLLSREFETLTEQAQNIEYNLNGVENKNISNSIDGRFAWVERYEAKGERTLNLSYYKDFKLYFYPVDYSSGNEELVYQFGDNPNNYFELRIPFKNIGESNGNNQNKWHELNIKLRGKDYQEQQFMNRVAYRDDHYFLLSKSSLEVKNEGNRDEGKLENVDFDDYTIRKIGNPSLYEVSYFLIGVDSKGQNATGRFWLNEFHVDNSEIFFGHAYRFGLTYKQNEPLQYRQRNIISETQSSFKYRHEGLGFSTLDQQANRNQQELSSFNLQTKILDRLRFSFNKSKDYDVSEYRESFLPKENQTLTHRDLTGFSFQLDLKDNLIIPTIQHTASYNKTRNLGFVTLSSNVINREYSLDLNEISVKTYSLGESKKFNFTPDLFIDQEYKIATTFNKIALLKKNVDINEVVFYNTQDPFFHPVELLDENSNKKRFPILEKFPNISDSIDEKRNLLEELEYSFYQRQSISTTLGIEKFRLDFRYTIEDQHNLLSTNISKLDLEKIASLYEKESIELQWYEFYWSEFSSIFSNPFIEDQSKYLSKKRNYSITFSYLNPVYIFNTPLLSSFNASISYSYAENNFRKTTTDFLSSEFILYQTNQNNYSSKEKKLLIDYSDQLVDFYQDEQKYKNIQNTLNLNLTLPIIFKNHLFKSLRLNFSRRLSLLENNVLDLKENDLSSSEKKLWKGIEDNFSDLSIGLKGEEQQLAYFEKIRSTALYFPYFDFWFLNDLAYAVISPFIGKLKNDERNRLSFLNAHRFWASKEIDSSINYRSKKPSFSGTEHISQFTSHSEFSSTVSHNESFRMEMNLSRIPILKDYLPSQFLYSGSLETRKTNWIIYQKQNRSLKLEKRFQSLSHYISRKWIPKAKDFERSINFSAALEFNENKDFNEKSLIKKYKFTLNNNYQLIKHVNIQSAYIFDQTETYYALRYRYNDTQGKTHYLPYLGIGPYHEIKSTDSTLKTEETLNLGELENIYFFSDINDFGKDPTDLIKRTHSFRLAFSWENKNPTKFFNLFSLPPNSSKRLSFDFTFYDYDLPFVNRSTLLEDGKVSPNDQPNAIGRKNLSLFTNPNNSKIVRNWLTKATFLNIYKVTENFSFETSFVLAVISEFVANSFQAYLKIPYNNNANWQENYLREDDYIQMGFDFSIKGKILF